MPVLQNCTLTGLVSGSHSALGALRASLHWTVRDCSPSPHDTEHCTQHAKTFILIPSKNQHKCKIIVLVNVLRVAKHAEKFGYIYFRRVRKIAKKKKKAIISSVMPACLSVCASAWKQLGSHHCTDFHEIR